ncbi:glycerophosphodiester phosphodiesterase domain protein [Leptospira weilii serovar Ranarum str. ICFT]|uniref:Glycerophosphodiester phosphodiesterase domain protein n=1 Tax=Leptospira weilii serovar Ranarum str. ICFT TaxID=1218598 RepID=N1WL85_9LEPT|nr:glycerophosphodiester phosphodiesterase [Leptospira weilii]EMY77909.1 glycerophosphodiester phosphodiesterase domain protein [Leptospira weilii serovar Ranarum str. ICFT]
MIENIKNRNDLKRPLVFAHRGFSGEFPENTMIAFQKAIQAKADLIELDVTLSEDREVVVIHDDDLDRTTKLVGNVRKFEAEILNELDAGSWFSRKFRKQKVPLLKDVLRLIQRSKTDLNIEIKSTALDFYGLSQDSNLPLQRNPNPQTPTTFVYENESSIEYLILSLLDRFQLLPRIVVSSFSWECLERIRNLNPEIKLGVLVGDGSGDVSEAIVFGEKIKAWSIHPSTEDASQENLRLISEKNFLSVVYTVNEVEEMKRFLDRGADGLFTNFPKSMRTLVKKKYSR